MSVSKKKSMTYDWLVPYRLWFIAETMEDLLEQYYRSAVQLSRTEWRILSTLSFRQPMTGKALAGWTSHDQSRVSQSLAQLRTRGLVKLTTDPADRRQKLIQLTAQGTAIFASIYPRAAALEREFLATLTPESKRSLLKAIDKLEQYALYRGLPPMPSDLHASPQPNTARRRRS
jgi:DNA-binding MarR family transcriptional regulator